MRKDTVHSAAWPYAESMQRTISCIPVPAILAAVVALGAWLALGPSVASACSGSPLFDARVQACGITIPAGLTEIEWNRGRVTLADALTEARLKPSDGTGSGPQSIEVWVERAPGLYDGWMRGSSMGLTVLEPGTTYIFAADEALSWSIPREATRPAAPAGASVFADAQVVSLYGFPGVPFMGALGKYDAEGAAVEAARVARQYDALNGSRGVTPALHLIASVAQADPGDGTYLGRMPLADVDRYVEVTAEHDQLLFIDVQVGWGDPLAEVKRYERQLRNPHVHIALDPEFSTKSDGEAPGVSIGSLTAQQINEVQGYLAALSATYELPSKVLVVHQFRDDMIEAPERIAAVDGVDLVIDMDGWGPQGQKLAGYDRYANSSYAEFAGVKLFYEWDVPLFTPRQIQALDPAPDYVIYQ